MSYPAITTSFSNLFPKQSSLAISTYNTVKTASMLGGAVIGVLISYSAVSNSQAFSTIFLISLILNIVNTFLIIFLNQWAKKSTDQSK